MTKFWSLMLLYNSRNTFMNWNCGRDFCAKRSKSVTEGVVDMRGSVFVDLHGNRKVLKKPTEGVNLPADADVEVVPKEPNASTLIPVVSL
ncbi:hypothetical protein RB195_010293 [Necator americanus]|uniref:Uncharacterized protein n=1 Tax=Necator americanus TaxID=51031 RepID=A0ABR1CXA8_NECAM